MSDATVSKNSLGLYDLIVRQDDAVEIIRNLELRVAAGKLEELLFIADHRKEASV